MTQPRSQCSTCARYRSAFSVTPFADGSFCEAFPDGIPDSVYENLLDHREPVDGDHGIRWQSNGRDEFPEYAFPADAIGRGSA